MAAWAGLTGYVLISTIDLSEYKITRFNCMLCTSYHTEGSDVGITLTGLTLPYFCACNKPGPWFPMPKVVVFFFVLNSFRWEVVVGFVDNGGIVDYHCLNFLFIILYFVITELSVGMTTEGIDVRSVGNTLTLHETALIEAFNLKAAIEYQLKNCELLSYVLIKIKLNKWISR